MAPTDTRITRSRSRRDGAGKHAPFTSRTSHLMALPGRPDICCFVPGGAERNPGFRRAPHQHSRQDSPLLLPLGVISTTSRTFRLALSLLSIRIDIHRGQHLAGVRRSRVQPVPCQDHADGPECVPQHQGIRRLKRLGDADVHPGAAGPGYSSAEGRRRGEARAGQAHTIQSRRVLVRLPCVLAAIKLLKLLFSPQVRVRLPSEHTRCVVVQRFARIQGSFCLLDVFAEPN